MEVKIIRGNTGMEGKLLNVIKWAYSHVPLYVKLAERNSINVDDIEELCQLPFVEKMYL